MKPYYLLDVPLDADDETIRKAYLKAVQQAGPETHPQRFQAVNEAYAQIKDEPSRLRYLLFDQTAPGFSPLGCLLDLLARRPTPKPLPIEQLKTRLRRQARRAWQTS